MAEAIPGATPEEANWWPRPLSGTLGNIPDSPLLVATFNRPQKEAIEDELDRMRADEPALRAFERLHPQGKEPLDVRNLETVQGDERTLCSSVWAMDVTSTALRRITSGQ